MSGWIEPDQLEALFPSTKMPDLMELLTQLEGQDPEVMSPSERQEWIAALEYVIERIEAALGAH